MCIEPLIIVFKMEEKMKHYKTQNESTIKTRMCICGVMPMFTQVYDEDADYYFDVVYCPK